MLSSSTRRSLLASTIIAGSLITSAAHAQGQATAANPTADAAATADEGQTIVVTGSLLSNPNLAQTQPVNVTTAEEINLRQNNVAEEVLRDIPGIVPDVGSAVNNGNGGASNVNLRGLGSNRNLVLIDGNRIVPADLAGVFDLNNIPLALIERVDALTGGASTTYGADAIAGVVNFVTKKNFSGIEMSLGEKITEQGDGNYLRADVTIGANFDDGRGNAVFSIGYQESDPVYQGARDFSRDSIDSFSGTLGGSGTAVPSRVTGTRNLAGTANNGTVFINPAAGTTGTGQLFNFNPYNVFQTPFKRYNMYGAANYQISDAIEVYTRGLFSKNAVKTIIAPSGAFGIAVATNLNNPYLPAGLANQFCAFDVDPTAAGYRPRFTPAECAAGRTATGPGDPNYRVIGLNTIIPFDANGDGVIAPGETINSNPAISLSRRLVEGGPRSSEFDTTLFDYRLGFKGGITSTINWDVSGGYGESENRQRITGYTLNSRFVQGLLANNTTTCINTANKCVPVNVFGPQGSITAAQAAFLQSESSTFLKTTLAQARAVISGDFGVASPFATDAISFAVGGEYRKYTGQRRSDALSKGGDLGGAGGATPDIDGSYDVYEAIGEVAVPLVQDKPFFNSLSVEGGVRYSHYTIGTPTNPKFNTTTWKVGGAWEPIRDIKFRGNYSHAVRAPNIGELFAPQNTVLTSLGTDPCASLSAAGVRTSAGPTGALQAVCIAQGATAGNVGTIQAPTAGQANITTGGNPLLKPEKSDSYTFGVVLQPTFLSGFSATVDYYHIKVKDAITTPTTADLIQSCFGGATAGNGGAGLPANAATNVACTQIRRNTLTGGLDGDPAISKGLFGALTNQGQLKTDGIDVAINYRTPLHFMDSFSEGTKLSLSFTGNYTFSSNFKANQNSATSYDRDCTGLFSTNCGGIQPKYQWSQRTTLTFGDVDVSLLWRHISKVKYEGTESDFLARGFTLANHCLFPYINTLPATSTTCPTNKAVLNNTPAGYAGYGAGKTFNFNEIKAYDYFDLSLRFGLTKNLDLTILAQNILDKQAPVIGANYAGSTAFNSGNTFPSTYDALGRKYSVGARLKF
ncbi:TonB-dependent receptor [Sphingomonas antarctica]|uniref:TonB-dependent receptor domain-containing protein n=1 Tax=Sphingomonas antarctica TaxID=2040274 RepID=UPI0039E74AE0